MIFRNNHDAIQTKSAMPQSETGYSSPIQLSEKVNKKKRKEKLENVFKYAFRMTNELC